MNPAQMIDYTKTVAKYGLFSFEPSKTILVGRALDERFREQVNWISDEFDPLITPVMKWLSPEKWEREVYRKAWDKTVETMNGWDQVKYCNRPGPRYHAAGYHSEVPVFQ